jgi:hypothetical protein
VMSLSFFRGVINILTHPTYVCEGKDRVEHFSLLPMMVAFMSHRNKPPEVKERTGRWQTYGRQEAFAKHEVGSAECTVVESKYSRRRRDTPN